MEVSMIKKFSLLMLCAFAVSYDTQAMDIHRPKQESPYNPLALHEACLRCNLEKVIEFLAAGASVKRKDSSGKTPLHIAAEKGYQEIAAALIRYKAPINDQDNNGETPLQKAALEGHKEVAALLLQNGARVNSKSHNNSTPLHKAVCRGNEGVVDLLINHKASLDPQDSNGCTPLHLASSNRDVQGVAARLIARGASIYRKNNAGNTPLHRAAYSSHYKTIELIMSTYFFPLSPSFHASSARSSLQERCLITLLKNFDKVGKKELVLQLAHFWTVDASIASMMAHRVPLKLQQSLVNVLKEHEAQEEQDVQQVQKAQQAIDVLVKEHCSRHVKKIKNLLKIKNNNHKIARDEALIKNYPKVIALFDELHNAKNFDELNENLKKTIIETIQRKLIII